MFSGTCCTSRIEADLAQKVFRSAYFIATFRFISSEFVCQVFGVLNYQHLAQQLDLCGHLALRHRWAASAAHAVANPEQAGVRLVMA